MDGKLTDAEMSLCAEAENLPLLSARYDDALHRGIGDLSRAALLLETALWWHRGKLIPALARSRLRLVGSS